MSYTDCLLHMYNGNMSGKKCVQNITEKCHVRNVRKAYTWGMYTGITDTLIPYYKVCIHSIKEESPQEYLHHMGMLQFLFMTVVLHYTVSISILIRVA
jgi:hypothetical protein